MNEKFKDVAHSMFGELTAARQGTPLDREVAAREFDAVLHALHQLDLVSADDWLWWLRGLDA